MGAFMSTRWLLPEGLVVEEVCGREAGVITIAARSPRGRWDLPVLWRPITTSPQPLPQGARGSAVLRAVCCGSASWSAAFAAPWPLPARRGSSPAPWRLPSRPPLLVARRGSIAWRINSVWLWAVARRRLGNPAAAARGPRHAAAHPPPPCGRPRGTALVIGIDDWAWRRGQRYGT